MDDTGSLDDKRQDLYVAQSAKDDSATISPQHQMIGLLVDCKVDVEMFSMPSFPHDEDPGNDVTETSDTAEPGVLKF